MTVEGYGSTECPCSDSEHSSTIVFAHECGKVRISKSTMGLAFGRFLGLSPRGEALLCWGMTPFVLCTGLQHNQKAVDDELDRILRNAVHRNANICSNICTSV